MFLLNAKACSPSVPAMGKEITSGAKEAWDSNAITPGTPFMELLANSLRYWVAQKLNTDPGWKDVGYNPPVANPTRLTLWIDASLHFRCQRSG